MTPNQIRRLDTIIGRSLCFCLTLVKRAHEFFFPPSSSPADPHKILFLKLIEQGATVLAIPAIRQAINRVGREQVYFMVFEENQEILHILDLVPRTNILTVRQRGIITFSYDLLRSLWRVHRLQIDVVIDLEFFARASAIIAYLSGATTRVGLHRFTSEGPYRGDLMTHRVQYNPYLHTALFYHLLVKAIDADPHDLPLLKGAISDEEGEFMRFAPQAEERSHVWDLHSEALGHAPSGRLVILNPNASDLLPLRKWPEEHFVALGRKVLEYWEELDVVITGAPAEASAGERIARQIGRERVICLAGKTTLRELLVLYTLAHVLVTNDSGPGHFASLTDIFNIVLFGPETPLLFGPLGGRGRVISSGLACSPCVNVFNQRFSPCRDNVCMKEITVEEVFETIKVVLEEGQG